VQKGDEITHFDGIYQLPYNVKRQPIWKKFILQQENIRIDQCSPVRLIDNWHINKIRSCTVVLKYTSWLTWLLSWMIVSTVASVKGWPPRWVSLCARAGGAPPSPLFVGKHERFLVRSMPLWLPHRLLAISGNWTGSARPVNTSTKKHDQRIYKNENFFTIIRYGTVWM
jgi:hypothetical protein